MSVKSQNINSLLVRFLILFSAKLKNISLMCPRFCVTCHGSCVTWPVFYVFCPPTAKTRSWISGTGEKSEVEGRRSLVSKDSATCNASWDKGEKCGRHFSSLEARRPYLSPAAQLSAKAEEAFLSRRLTEPINHPFIQQPLTFSSPGAKKRTGSLCNTRPANWIKAKAVNFQPKKTEQWPRWLASFVCHVITMACVHWELFICPINLLTRTISSID